MKHRRKSLIFLLLFLFACGHSAGVGGHPPAPGDAEAAPSLAVLPELVEIEGKDRGRVRQGMLVAQNAFDRVMPDPPRDRSYVSLQAWIDGPVLVWLKQRRLAVVESRYLFGVGRDAPQGDQAVGEAVAGLLQEDTALALQTIPVPSELGREPEIRDMFVEIVQKQTHPLLSAALVSFRECSDLAYTGPEQTMHFAYFCDARFRRLREQLKGPGTATVPMKPVAMSAAAR